MSLADLLEEIEAIKAPEKAGLMEAYMRHQFLFLGIAGSERNALYGKYFPSAKKTRVIDWDFVDICWEKEPREYQYVDANYLKAMQSYLAKDDLLKLERLVVIKSWWDTVDILDRVVGSLVANHPELEEVLLKWSLSDNIWLRQVAIDHQLLRKEKTNVQLMEKILLNNLDQTEFFINKVTGWALRDYSKTNPEWVARFIDKNKKRMAELSVREASMYL